MRITYLHQYFNTPDMPGGTRSFELGRRLVEMGHEVHMVTSWRKAGEKTGWFETEECGIQVHWLPNAYSNRMGFNARVRAFFRFAWRAAARARRIDGDVVFATSTPLTIAIPAIFASFGRRSPMVFEVRDLWPELPIAVGALSNPLLIKGAEALEWIAYKRSRHVVALSPGMAEGVTSRGIPSDRVSVIPNSSDLTLFKPDPSGRREFRSEHPWIGSRPLVVYTGTLGRINGVAYLARLAAEVKDRAPEIRFLVVGDGAEWEEVEAIATKSGILGENFRMWRRIPKRELPKILAAADLATSLVIDEPALWNNSANKFFDALSSGTPLAINYRGWQAKLLSEHRAGIVVDPMDIKTAAENVMSYVNSPESLEEMGANARALAEAEFSRDDHARQLEAILRGAVNEGKGTRSVAPPPGTSSVGAECAAGGSPLRSGEGST